MRVSLEGFANRPPIKKYKKELSESENFSLKEARKNAAKGSAAMAV